MLTFYWGERLSPLADCFTDLITEKPLGDPMKEEIVVVQNYGMARWLSMSLAEKKGVAANLKFEFPSERIWSMLREMDSTIPESLPSDRNPMVWSLMKVLAESEDEGRFSVLYRYTENQEEELEEYRRWKLCSRIAEVFDQYLIYRPELLLEWEEGGTRTGMESELWQAELWRRLNEYWQHSSEHDWTHRSHLQQHLLERLDQDFQDPSPYPERVSVFGISSMPPAFIKTLVKLSKHTDVRFYWHSTGITNTDELIEHPLLKSFGGEGKDFVDLIFNNMDREPDLKARVEKIESSGHESRKDLLFMLQEEILTHDRDKSEPEGNAEVDPIASIQVHSCHSPMREVEELYDRLLALFDEHEELYPSDVLIMMPDIESYAPIIEAVFGSVEEGLPEIPYSIADREVKKDSAAIGTFLNILELLQSRFKVTDILDLLDAEVVREQFGFNGEDLNKLERWIEKNRIRWGLDENSRKEEALPATDKFTWQSGIDRMLLGYAMDSESDRLFNGRYPYDEIESSDDANLLGRFAHFIHLLSEYHKESREARSTGQWEDWLAGLLNEFIPETREYLWELNTIRTGIAEIEEHTNLVGYNDKISFRIIRSWLDQKMSKSSKGSGFMGRGVTFCDLVPMRSIPFRVIGMIGMNDGAFPRVKIPAEFDLIALNPEKGDRSRKLDDRYLFLENIIAAGDYLYISYVGQSNRSDTRYPPSVVVRELVDHLEQKYDISRADLITEHRLQPFSPAYFTEGETLFSYSSIYGETSRLLLEDKNPKWSFIEGQVNEPEDEWRSVEVSDLVRFYQHPSKFLLKNRLKIYLREEKTLTEDREPFSLEGLDRYALGQELLDHFMKGESLEDYRKVAEAADLLPMGWPGTHSFNRQMQNVRDFGKRLERDIDKTPLDPVNVDIKLDNFRLTGMLESLYPSAQIIYRYGRMRAKDRVEAWIKHIILQLVKPENHPGSSRGYARDTNYATILTKLKPAENSREILKELLDGYWKGLCKPYCFFPESSYLFARDRLTKDKTYEQSISSASGKWSSDYGDYKKEGDDLYNKLIYKYDNPLKYIEFDKISISFWRHYFANLEAEEKIS